MAADDFPLILNIVAASISACFADFITFPFDTAKIRLQIQGEPILPKSTVRRENKQFRYKGVFGTITTIVKTEGVRSLFNGLTAGLQRQALFAAVKIGCYDTVKSVYSEILFDNNQVNGLNIEVRVAAGCTTGSLAVLCAQPTDVVKIRFQTQLLTDKKYSSIFQAYKTIAITEGVKGLWKGTLANATKNSVTNISEIVCYDVVKDVIITQGWLEDRAPCHFIAGVVAGFCTTIVSSPIDVVTVRFMNSTPGSYTSAINCTRAMFGREGFSAFYKGCAPSFCRLVTWNIVMWTTFEQIKIFLNEKNKNF